MKASMKAGAALPVVLALADCASQPPLPIASGTYRFRQRFAEHPSMQGTEFAATIDGRRIRVVNDGDSSVFPRGVVETGTLVWHARSREWVIATQPADADAEDVGGCSDGPTVVDLVARVYWTC